MCSPERRPGDLNASHASNAGDAAAVERRHGTTHAPTNHRDWRASHHLLPTCSCLETGSTREEVIPGGTSQARHWSRVNFDWAPPAVRRITRAPHEVRSHMANRTR
jgi:hypothetical protein